MEQAILINGKRITLKATAGALVRYRQQFGTEYVDALQDAKDGNTLDKMTVGFNLVWTMAKTAYASTPAPEEFLKIFRDEDDVATAIDCANKLFARSLSGIKESDGANGEKLTSENLIALCMACGLSTTDIDNLSLSLLLNSINEYNRLRGVTDSGKRKATQSDFDAF